MATDDDSPRSSPPLDVLVVGATGGTGRATVARLVRESHRVTAFSRHASAESSGTDRVRRVNGDVMIPADVERAVQGQDVVIVTLGIGENPLRVRLLGPSRTPLDVRSRGTRNVVDAMRKHGVERLIVQSSYGVGETRALLRFVDRLFFRLILAPQIEDTEAQERVVRASGLDWVLVQPVHLSDEKDVGTAPFLSTRGETRTTTVARSSVAGFLVAAARERSHVGETVAVSGQGTVRRAMPSRSACASSE